MKVKGTQGRCVKELNLIPVIAFGERRPARLRGTAFAHAKDLLSSILLLHAFRTCVYWEAVKFLPPDATWNTIHRSRVLFSCSG